MSKNVKSDAPWKPWQVICLCLALVLFLPLILLMCFVPEGFAALECLSAVGEIIGLVFDDSSTVNKSANKPPVPVR